MTPSARIRQIGLEDWLGEAASESATERLRGYIPHSFLLEAILKFMDEQDAARTPPEAPHETR